MHSPISAHCGHSATESARDGVRMVARSVRRRRFMLMVFHRVEVNYYEFTFDNFCHFLRFLDLTKYNKT